MPQPTVSDVHVDAALSDISIAFLQDETKYVAGRVFPPVPVDHRTDKYHVWEKNDFLRDEAEVRPPATESAGGGITLTQDSYSCDVFAFHKDIDAQVRANADPAVDLERTATLYVTQVMLTRRERQFADDYFKLGVWTTDVVGATDFAKWTDATSDPEKDVADGVKSILKLTGFKPNVLLVGFDVHQALKRHPLIKDRYKHTSAESITADMIARFLEIDRYMVSEAIFATNVEGGTKAYDFHLGSDAMLVFANPTPGLMMPSAGYNFVWRGLTGMNDLGVAIANIPVPLKKADRIEGEFAFDMKVVSKELGYFFSAAV